MELNIFNKTGFLTDEDRKEKLEHDCYRLTFSSCIDLSEDVIVTSFGSGDVTLEQYSKDLAAFMCWWTIFVHGDLNGFSGFHHVKFVPVGFKIL